MSKRAERTVTIEESSHERTSTPAPQLLLALQGGNLNARLVGISLRGIDEVRLGRGPFDIAEITEEQGKVLVVSIDDDRMSRAHAQVRATDAGFEFADLGSKNGSFLDGRPVFSGQQRGLAITDGSVLETGRTFFVFRQSAPVGAGDFGERVRPPVEIDGVRTLAPVMMAFVDQAEKIAPSSVPVFLYGPTGSGKEVFARFLHSRSGRSGAFVGVNAAALPSELAAAELFGATKGAFTGADRAREGLIRAAAEGTLFLDEIADLSLAAQAVVLRALQEKEVTPVGATTPIKVDFRLVTATNQDLGDAVARGAFRADLFARINGLTLSVPPLRDRREDIGLLLNTFLARMHVSPSEVQLSPLAARSMMLHSYPLNVRELEQGFQTATELARQQATSPMQISSVAFSPVREQLLPHADVGNAADVLAHEVERQLREHHGNVSAVAAVMGKQRNQVYRWVQRFGLRPQDYRRSRGADESTDQT